MKTIALLSMLHESAVINSATRHFRDDAVIGWTVNRLSQSIRLNGVLIAAWSDQVEAVEKLGLAASIRDVGARRAIATLDGITAAQNWANGWRGGLLSTCSFDRGYVGAVAMEAVSEVDALVLIDPASALVDAHIVDRMIEAASAGGRDFYFSQSPPGVAGVVLKRAMVQKLVDGNTHPGRIVHYLPDAPAQDPVTSDACVEMPLEISRSTQRLIFDSHRQISSLSHATESLNGTLKSTSAQGILEKLSANKTVSEYPREITVELTSHRASRPVFQPGTHLALNRSDLPVELFRAIVAESRRIDDLRLVLSGAGDPLLHPDFDQIVHLCADLPAVSIETDLIHATDEQLRAIVNAGIDIVAVHLPATTPQRYAQAMGVDSLAKVIENVRKLVLLRQQANRGRPLIAPVFTKMSQNLDEMENWFDTWLRAVSNAVIVGPSDYCGQIPDLSAADMTPAVRRACNRIESRLTILSNGAIVMCEQDIQGRFPLGQVVATDQPSAISETWKNAMASVRDAHHSRRSLPVLCSDCREWHRP